MPLQPSILFIDLQPGQALVVGEGNVIVQLVHKTGRVARMRVTAPRDVKIDKKSDEPVTEVRTKAD